MRIACWKASRLVAPLALQRAGLFARPLCPSQSPASLSFAKNAMSAFCNQRMFANIALGCQKDPAAIQNELLVGKLPVSPRLLPFSELVFDPLCQPRQIGLASFSCGKMQQVPSATKDSLQTLSWDAKKTCLLYTSPSPRDRTTSRMPSSA